MLLRIFPWKYFLKLAARRYDFVDPISYLARLRSFAQPSEVQEPIELLRAGMVFHARGLLNTKAIQHNLDWVWPYWIVRQFNPSDPSFIPRAFSFSHVNLTHRNWTAVGLPDLALYPIVDPHGLVTPLHDGWSVDCWFYGRNGESLFPSTQDHVDQHLIDDDNRRVVTESSLPAARLQTTVWMDAGEENPVVTIEARVKTGAGGWLIVALRPFNPEGIQFIETAETLENGPGWLVNEETEVLFSAKPDKILYANYKLADVSSLLDEEQTAHSSRCRIGMVTSAAFFKVADKDGTRKITVRIPLEKPARSIPSSRDWIEALAPAAVLKLPDEKIKFLYDAAVRTLVHLAADDIVPGPYTYNRFWFRDACMMLHPMLAIGLRDLCRRQLDRFELLQKRDGYFHSQEGEWDSNGQVLWVYNRYRLLSGGDYGPGWIKAMRRGARWIAEKRVLSKKQNQYNGLLPPGFSAEHFGPNDYYYWDDFWAVAGLYGTAEMLEACGLSDEAAKVGLTALDMKGSVLRSIKEVMNEKQLRSIPVSPNRRMDSGAIGSLAADYPLQLFPPADERIMATADYLMEKCLHRGCFFQDMIHSGINIYMTLMLAQVYLRAEDPRYYDLLAGAAGFASPTGQWPEAIHPITSGGCMGDGQHGWAAAEWVMLIRNIFVFEEKERLIIGRGIRQEWLRPGTEISFGPTLTPYGRITVSVIKDNGVQVRLTADWYRDEVPEIIVRIPGFKPDKISPPEYLCRLEPA
ncbi:MAG: hypothetical protein SCH71_13370 [Desulfobulbaceae bacterium]|nr:hypothetical protein [Desulfobulbaceae bacterium]